MTKPVFPMPRTSARRNEGTKRTIRQRLLSVLTVPVLATSLGACGIPAASPSPGTTTKATQTAQQSPSTHPPATADEPAPERKTATGSAAPEGPSAGTALAQLETITIKGRAPRTGYDRDKFGYGWMDPDGNGCDTRIICTARAVVALRSM